MRGFYVNTSFYNENEYNEEICDTRAEAVELCRSLGLPKEAIRFKEA